MKEGARSMTRISQVQGCALIGVESLRSALMMIGISSTRPFSGMCKKGPEDAQSTIGKQDFDEMLATKKESAPGPDGIPYSIFTSVRVDWDPSSCKMRTNSLWREAWFAALLRVGPFFPQVIHRRRQPADCEILGQAAPVDPVRL